MYGSAVNACCRSSSWAKCAVVRCYASIYNRSTTTNSRRCRFTARIWRAKGRRSTRSLCCGGSTPSRPVSTRATLIILTRLYSGAAFFYIWANRRRLSTHTFVPSEGSLATNYSGVSVAW